VRRKPQQVGVVKVVGRNHRVVRLVPRITREREQAAARGERCAKCGSTFVMREPVFLHCLYCGSLARLAGGSLLAQQLFELRSGLRLAS
jgi:hypothetical protein